MIRQPKQACPLFPGQFNTVNQLAAYTGSATSQTVSGYVSAPVTDVKVNTHGSPTMPMAIRSPMRMGTVTSGMR